MSSNNELVITFKGDTSDALSKTNGLKGALGGLGDLASGALKVGLLGAVGGIAALAGGLTAAVGAAMEAEQGQAALAAVLASTGGKAGVTADMANNLASALQNVTRFEDDTVLAGENLLLTFTNIGKDVFPAATETMLNMATAMGGDVKGAAVQLGKALNDPVNGMTALTRVGVTFTDAQKEQIKALQESGDLMGAQKIILAELETEFGGAARAAGDTFAGKLDILNHKFGDIMEGIGGMLIPILTAGADAFIGIADAIGQVFEYIAAGDAGNFAAIKEMLTSAFGPEIGGAIAEVVGHINSFFYSLSEGWSILDAFKFLIEDVFGESGTSTITGFADTVMVGIQGLIGVFQGLVDWLTGTLGPALAESFGTIAEAAMPTLQTFGDWIQTTLVPALQGLANWLGPILGAAFQGLGIFITEIALPALTKLGVWIFETGLPAFGNFANQVGGVLNAAFKTAAQLWGQLVKGFEDAVKFVEDTKTALDDLATALTTTVANAFLWFKDNVLQPIQDALAGLAAYIQKVLDMLNKLGGWGGAPVPQGGGGGTGGGTFAGERFGIGGMARGGTVVNLTYAPVVSLMDEAEASTKLAPFVREAVLAAMGT